MLILKVSASCLAAICFPTVATLVIQIKCMIKLYHHVLLYLKLAPTKVGKGWRSWPWSNTEEASSDVFKQNPDLSLTLTDALLSPKPGHVFLQYRNVALPRLENGSTVKMIHAAITVPVKMYCNWWNDYTKWISSWQGCPQTMLYWCTGTEMQSHFSNNKNVSISSTSWLHLASAFL